MILCCHSCKQQSNLLAHILWLWEHHLSMDTMVLSQPINQATGTIVPGILLLLSSLPIVSLITVFILTGNHAVLFLLQSPCTGSPATYRGKVVHPVWLGIACIWPWTGVHSVPTALGQSLLGQAYPQGLQFPPATILWGHRHRWPGPSRGWGHPLQAYSHYTGESGHQGATQPAHWAIPAAAPSARASCTPVSRCR